MSQTTILALVDDLFFLSKIQQTARLLGMVVKVADPAKLTEEITQAQPKVVIVDLNLRSRSILEVLHALKGNPTTKPIPVVAFVSHVQSDLIAAAREAGCDLVMARSAFTERLPELLKNLPRLEASGAPNH